MVWTQPKTWSSEPLTSSDLNTHLRDNLEYLKGSHADYVLNESSEYTTTSTSFVDVDATKLALTLATKGGDVFVHFHAHTYTAAGVVFFDVAVDGVRNGGDDGYIRNVASSVVSFTRLIKDLSVGNHTFKLQWKVTSGGTATMNAGSGVTNQDIHPQFWVHEVS